jgi:hypothetical protein
VNNLRSWKFPLTIFGATCALYAPIELGRMIWLYISDYGYHALFAMEYAILAIGVSFYLWLLWDWGKEVWRRTYA